MKTSQKNEQSRNGRVTLGAEGDGDSVCELVHSLEHLVPAIIAKHNVLGVGPALRDHRGANHSRAGNIGREHLQRRRRSASDPGKHAIMSSRKETFSHCPTC